MPTQIKFSKELKLQEALLLDPRAKSVMTHFLIGGCHNPFVLPSNTIEEACLSCNAPLERVLKALNDLDAVPAHQGKVLARLQ